MAHVSSVEDIKNQRLCYGVGKFLGSNELVELSNGCYAICNKCYCLNAGLMFSVLFYFVSISTLHFALFDFLLP